MKIERMFSNVEEEKLYSTGNDELDDLLERAFCEGYEYAQREFGRTGLSAQQAKQFFTKVSKGTGKNKLSKEFNPLNVPTTIDAIITNKGFDKRLTSGGSLVKLMPNAKGKKYYRGNSKYDHGIVGNVKDRLEATKQHHASRDIIEKQTSDAIRGYKTKLNEIKKRAKQIE